LLLDTRRLHLRAVAHVARQAPAYAGSPPFDIWLAENIRRAVREIQQELAAEDAPSAGTNDERFAALADGLGLDPALLSSACARFNRSPYEARSAFWWVVVDGRPIAEWCRENGANMERAKAALRKALWALGVREGLDLDRWLEGGGHDA
jgi:cytochrome c1